MRYLTQYIYMPFAMMMLMASCAVEGRNDNNQALDMPMESMYCTKNSCTIINEDTKTGVTKSSQEILDKLDDELKYALNGDGAYSTFLSSPANEKTQVVFVDLDTAFVNAGINPHKILVILSSSHFRKDKVQKTEQMVSLQSLKEGIVLHNVKETDTVEMEAVFILTDVEDGYEALKNKLSSEYVFPFTINFKQFAAN